MEDLIKRFWVDEHTPNDVTGQTVTLDCKCTSESTNTESPNFSILHAIRYLKLDEDSDEGSRMVISTLLGLFRFTSMMLDLWTAWTILEHQRLQIPYC